MAILDEDTAYSPAAYTALSPWMKERSIWEQLVGLGEAGLQVGGGLLGTIAGLPQSILQTIGGRGSPEMQEKYEGIDPYVGGTFTEHPLTSGELAARMSQHPIFSPNTEMGKELSAVIGEGGQKLDKFLRDVSGYLPSKMGWLSPELKHAIDQGTYTALSVVNPIKAVRAGTSVAKGGWHGFAADPHLSRQDLYGVKDFDIPWYAGKVGRAWQQTGMFGSVLKSKLTNFLNPKAAYLFEQRGISQTSLKELNKLKRLYDEYSKKNPKDIWGRKKDGAPITYRQQMQRITNDYINEWANIIAQARIYRPDHPALKVLSKELIDQVFPTSKTAKMIDVEANPQIIGKDILSSAIPDGVIRHLFSDMRTKLGIKGENIEFVRKPTEPYKGTGVRTSAQAPRKVVRKGVIYQDNVYTSLKGVGYAGGGRRAGILETLWKRNQAEAKKNNTDAASITKDDIIAEAKRQNAEMQAGNSDFGTGLGSRKNPGTRANYLHDIELLEKNIQRGDGYLSFGNASLTPDRLLATMRHRWVVDPDTGMALLFNFDHVRFGSGWGWLDKLVNVGAKKRFVVVDVTRSDLLKGVRDPMVTKWDITNVAEVTPKIKSETGGKLERFITKGQKQLDVDVPPEFISSRTAETLAAPPLAGTGLDYEN